MFYVYILRNPITELPFYIGVGKRGRKSACAREKQHEKDALRFRRGGKLKHPNRHKFHTILQILDQGAEIEIEIHSEYSNEQEAFNKEIELISLYGRRDLKTGILTNLSDGGEGCVNQSLETREKRSRTMRGRRSPLKGVTVGPYSKERRIRQKEKMKRTSESLSDEEKIKRYQNRSNAQKGKIAWNKGLTRNDPRVAKYADSKIGKPRPDMLGKEPWNKGKKCPELGKVGRTPWNKGIPSKKKGMSYEELYGAEKANELKEKRRQQKIKYWEDKQGSDGGLSQN